MTTLIDRTIAALRTNHDDLSALVRRLDAADLERLSSASEWTVAQVLSHLGSGAEIGLASLRAALTGEDAPAQDFNQSVWPLGRQGPQGARRGLPERQRRTCRHL